MQSLTDLTAAILAGGLGTRLRHAIPDRPKVLAEVAGRPFLEHLLDQLQAAGVRQVVLCTGHQGDQVREQLGSCHGTMRLEYSQEPAPMGTAGALRLALPLLRSDPVLVLNGDSFCDVDFRAFRHWHLGKPSQASLTLTEVPDTSRYGEVHLTADGAVRHFREKGGRLGAGLINAGVYMLGHALLSEIPAEGTVSLERGIFPRLIGRGLYGYRTSARFLDIGTPESYAAATPFFAQRAGRTDRAASLPMLPNER